MKKSELVIKMYAITATLLLAGVVLSSFTNQSQNRFKEITVERINIVEADGKVRMVISNKERQHPGLINGKVQKPRERAAGMIFFSETDEIGGLIFEGDEKQGNSISWTTDKWKNDQVMQLAQFESNEGQKSFYGLRIMERPNTPHLDRMVGVLDSLDAVEATPQERKTAFNELFGGKPGVMSRVFLGKKTDNSGGLWLTDRNNQARVNLFIDADNNPHFDIYDEKGNKIKDLLKD